MNWDDLRYVLAVVDCGGVAAAARELGVNHATVLRRVSAFEKERGINVFERSANGYRLRPEMARVIEAARAAAQSIGAVESLIDRESGAGPALLRLTCVDSIAQMLLAPNMGEIAKAVAPAQVELIVSNQHLDLSRLEADVAVRPTRTLPDQLTGEVAFDMPFHVYEAPGCADSWIGMTGPLARVEAWRWLSGAFSHEHIVARADSFLILREMAAAGSGRAFLPSFLGDADMRLRRSSTVSPSATARVWVACNREIAQVPRIADLVQATVETLRAAVSALPQSA